MPSDNSDDVKAYYAKTESRLGYDFFLHGTKHFGYYEKGDFGLNFPKALRKMEDQLGAAIGLDSGSRVLDAGCGMGDVACHLARTRGYRVTGIDILDFNITEARRRAAKRGLAKMVSFNVMSYSALEFPEDSFDGVYTMETLVHAANAAEVLENFSRVLRPGGHLTMFEYSRAPEDEMPRAAAEAYRYVNEVAAMPSFQKFTHGRLETLLKEAGFVDISTRDITEQMAPMLRAFSVIGQLPYALGKALDVRQKVVNAMSAVEFWRYRQYFRYNIYTARKPKSFE